MYLSINTDTATSDYLYELQRIFATKTDAEQLIERSKPPTPLGRYSGVFGYQFPESIPTNLQANLPAKVATAIAQYETGTHDSMQYCAIPPVFPFFCQFLKNDILAEEISNVDKEKDAGLHRNSNGKFVQPGRRFLSRHMRNVWPGTLSLCCLYGTIPSEDDELGIALTQAMRNSTAPSQMRLAIRTAETQRSGECTCSSTRIHESLERPKISLHSQRTIPLLSDLIEFDNQASLYDCIIGRRRRCYFGPIDQSDKINSGADSQAKHSFNNLSPIIADARNSENLFLSQIHSAFLHLHNEIVKNIACSESPRVSTTDQLYLRARQLVQFHYQWLVVNELLAKICDPVIIRNVLQREAPMYRLFNQNTAAGSFGLPVPIEFARGAFMFQDSLIRPEYHLSANQQSIEFELLTTSFASVQNKNLNSVDDLCNRQLCIDWQLLASEPLVQSKYGCASISLENLLNNQAYKSNGCGFLIEALRENYFYTLPSAQECIASLLVKCGVSVTPMSGTELTSGAGGKVINRAGLVSQTPLFLYILQEASVVARGKHLGPLGSYMLADTLVGLVINDPDSYWNHTDENGNRWQPTASAQTAGVSIDSLATLLSIAGSQ